MRQQQEQRLCCMLHLQVLHMLVMPELGPGHVLTAEKSLSSRSSSEHRPQQLQQQQSPGQTLLAGVNQMQQQMGQAVTVSPAADVQRLDIAERDWSAVADAIQGATPLQVNSMTAEGSLSFWYSALTARGFSAVQDRSLHVTVIYFSACGNIPVPHPMV